LSFRTAAGGEKSSLCDQDSLFGAKVSPRHKSARRNDNRGRTAGGEKSSK